MKARAYEQVVTEFIGSQMMATLKLQADLEKLREHNDALQEHVTKLTTELAAAKAGRSDG